MIGSILVTKSPQVCYNVNVKHMKQPKAMEIINGILAEMRAIDYGAVETIEAAKAEAKGEAK